MAGRLRRGTGALRMHGRLTAAVLVVATVVAVTAVELGGESERTSSNEPSPSAIGTATVARRTLAEHLTVTGKVGFAGESTVLGRLSGTVTALPAIGDVVRRGQRLYGVSGEPVILMYGAVPAYRTLAEGATEGLDVEQLERNLANLGYDPGAVDEAFTSETSAAIAAWQGDLGLEESGEVELGRVAFLNGAQRVTGLEATLGEALGGAGGGGGSELIAWHPEVEEAEAVEGGTTSGESGEQEPESKPESKGHVKPESETEPPPSDEPKPRESEPEPAEPKHVAPSDEAHEADEPKAEPGSFPILRTSSTRRIVRAELEADQQRLAHRGQKVEILLPGGSEVPGVVSRLSAVEPSAGSGNPGEESEAAVEATVSVIGRHRVPAIDGATVSVLLTQRVRSHVLSVPLTALVAVGGERFAVVVAEGTGGRRLEVTPGVAADGYVEVKGQGLREGMRVEVGE